MPAAQIHHLFTSPGHNFFGRHGQKSEDFEIVEHTTVELVAGKGIVGDRFFGWKEDYKGQITFIDQAIISKVREHAENPDLPAKDFRRNVVISGIDLNALIGKTFSIGEIQLIATEECRPCYWMDEACGKPGTEDLMKGHGGLRCRILKGGVLSKGNIGVRECSAAELSLLPHPLHQA